MKKIAAILLISLLAGGCVYFNTFYHAKTFFNEAESSRKKEKRDTARGAELTSYQNAIKKCSKVLSEYPGSKYEDDALFIIGKSFYYLGDFSKAERKFRELLASYPQSKFAEESRFFLGKSRYQMENYILAAEIFEQFLGGEKKSKWRPEALYLMGDLYYEQERYKDAIAYYQDFVKAYKSDFRAPDAQMRIGQIYFELEHFDSAAVAFGKAAKSLENENDKFDAFYQQGVSLYWQDSLSAGRKLFKALAENKLYENHLAKIRLRLAEGEYLSGEPEMAIRNFDEITSDYENSPDEAEAYYNMGIIIQQEFDDLETAKEMFDRAARVPKGGEYKQLALEKSANIAKAEEYYGNLNSDELELVVQNQFLLAELNRLTLNRPDSALQEYLALVENYPGSDLAPRSLLAAGWLYENQYHDTLKAIETYRKVIHEYPYSDEYQDALKLLSLEGSQYDSLYAQKQYHLAEEQLLDEDNPDSAMVLLKSFKHRYRDSHLLPKAELAMAKIELMRFAPKPAPPGDSTFVDSSMIWVFHELGKKYAGTAVGEEANRLASGTTKEKPKPRRQQQQQQQEQSDTSAAQGVEEPESEWDDTLTAAQIEELKIQKILEELPLAPEIPTVEPEFEYPYSAYGDPFEGKIMTKIKIEFDGRVTEVELIKPSGQEDIDKEVERVLLLTEFDPMEIEPLNIGGYFIYYHQVTPPENIRRRE